MIYPRDKRIFNEWKNAYQMESVVFWILNMSFRISLHTDTCYGIVFTIIIYWNIQLHYIAWMGYVLFRLRTVLTFRFPVQHFWIPWTGSTHMGFLLFLMEMEFLFFLYWSLFEVEMDLVFILWHMKSFRFRWSSWPSTVQILHFYNEIETICLSNIYNWSYLTLRSIHFHASRSVMDR